MSDEIKDNNNLDEDSKQKTSQSDGACENAGMDDSSENMPVESSGQKSQSANLYLRSMLDTNFIEYASYVIKERAIPDVDDGLKPVQRRILWALRNMDDGKFHKVANVIGQTMQYHPHGDASIGDALVVLANKEFFIDRQGNFGNLYTGDGASAPRYIECRLSKMGNEVLFNDDITEFMPSYDGRNKEPLLLPVKIPSMLMLGAEGIAVGMATKILPHNFVEVLDAQIKYLHGEEFEVYPDFQQGGLMDVREYDRGNGKIRLRAKIEIDGRKLIIREIPASTTTESLIASIEKAVERNKIKIAAINDYTAEQVEIELELTRGYDPEKALSALYMYTDCSVSISVNMTVICENRPIQMNTQSVIKRNTDRLLEYLRRELEIAKNKLLEQYHCKTLAQIFIENRIYKQIEECDTSEKVMAAVYKGLEPFRDRLQRDVTDDDVERLLAIAIRRISLFDILKNEKELRDILKEIANIEKNLKRLVAYAVKYLEDLKNKYGAPFGRRTEIETFEKIDHKTVALNNIKVYWDRKNGYIGTAVKSDDYITCNEFDLMLCVERTGTYKIINIPEKLFVGRLYDFRKNDPAIRFAVIYRDNKTNKFYGKRTIIDKFIKDKEYRICPENCRLDLITPRADAVYTLNIERRLVDKQVDLNLLELPLRSAKARGILIGSEINKITHSRYLTPEEIAQFNDQSGEGEEDDNENSQPESELSDNSTNQGDNEVAAAPDASVASESVKNKSQSNKIVEAEKAVVRTQNVHKSTSRKKADKTEKILPDNTPDSIAVVPEDKNNSDDADSDPKVQMDGNVQLSTDDSDEAKTTDSAEKDNSEKTDEWGIVQPDFGF